MPYHRYPNRSNRPITGPTAGSATCLGWETLAIGEKGFAQALSETGF